MAEKVKNPFAKKVRRQAVATVYLDEGETIEVKLRALSPSELDEVRSEHPPTPEQRENGMGVNEDTFQPALFAACSVEPKFTYEQALEVWQSPDWSAGELMYLYGICSKLCFSEANVPPSASV